MPTVLHLGNDVKSVSLVSAQWSSPASGVASARFSLGPGLVVTLGSGCTPEGSAWACLLRLALSTHCFLRVFLGRSPGPSPPPVSRTASTGPRKRPTRNSGLQGAVPLLSEPSGSPLAIVPFHDLPSLPPASSWSTPCLPSSSRLSLCGFQGSLQSLVAAGPEARPGRRVAPQQVLLHQAHVLLPPPHPHPHPRHPPGMRGSRLCSGPGS